MICSHLIINIFDMDKEAKDDMLKKADKYKSFLGYKIFLKK